MQSAARNPSSETVNKPRVHLVHWNASEAKERAGRLRRAGYTVAHEVSDADGLRSTRRSTPDAVVIDLSRLPAQGRDVALDLRHRKITRHVPIVFVDGAPEKIERVRKQVRDAVYTTWRGINGALKRVIANPPKDPVVPSSALAGYSGTPLVKKLGTKPNSTLALVGAPEGFEQTLGTLPDGVTIRHHARGKRDLTIWFLLERSELKSRLKAIAAVVGDGGLWIAWPTRASGVVTDLTPNDVRGAGLAAGLVDYKICAIDDTWSGLKFATRKKR